MLYGNGATPVLQKFVDGNPNFPTTNTDWQDQVYRTAWTNNLTASISNNTEKSSILMSLNYINQNDNINDTFYERYSARVNSRYDFNKYISVGENLVVARWKNRGVDVAGDRGKINMFIDHSILDIFINDKWTTSMRVFPTDNSADGLEVFSKGTTKVIDLKAWNLDVESSDSGIDAICSDKGNSTEVDVYNLQGMRLRSRISKDTVSAELPSGTYIIDNKKIILR